LKNRPIVPPLFTRRFLDETEHPKYGVEFVA
jgi:hypothetical protein